MAKTTKVKKTEKVSKKVSKKKENTSDSKYLSGKYSIRVALNGLVFDSQSDDILSAILDCKQIFLKTKMVVTIKLGEQSITRQLMLQQAKRFFWDKTTQYVFIRNFIFK